MAYLKINRNFRKSAFYKKASCAQREVFLELIERVNYESQIINFGANKRLLTIGQLWFSREGIVKALVFAKVKDSHVRYAVKKMVDAGFLVLVCSARKGGSIYECTSDFYTEVAEPFDIRKLTNKQPINNQQVTNKQPINNQYKALINSDLQDVTTNKQPISNQQVTNKQPIFNHIERIKEEKNERINGNGITQNQNHFHKNSSLKSFEKKSEDLKRKKVAAKKEKEFKFPAAPKLEDPLKIYFESKEQIKFWRGKYPLLDVQTELRNIYKALLAKAANGNAQLGNPYSYVLKCMENAEKGRQQRVNSQKLVKNGNQGKHKHKAKVSDWTNAESYVSANGVTANDSWWGIE